LAFSSEDPRPIINLVIGTLRKAGFDISRRKLEIIGPGERKILNGVLLGRVLSVPPDRLARIRSGNTQASPRAGTENRPEDYAEIVRHFAGACGAFEHLLALRRATRSGARRCAMASTQSGLSENVAGLLCYVLGWITGLVFFLIDKRPYVRFHAAQSLVVFGGLHILRIVLAMVFGIGWWFGGGMGLTGFSFGWLLFSLLGLVTLILWIVLMVKAYQGERFKVPIAGDFAESFAGK